MDKKAFNVSMCGKVSDWYKQNVIRHQWVGQIAPGRFYKNSVLKQKSKDFNRRSVQELESQMYTFSPALWCSGISGIWKRSCYTTHTILPTFKPMWRFKAHGDAYSACYIPELTTCTNSRLPSSISRPDTRWITDFWQWGNTLKVYNQTCPLI